MLELPENNVEDITKKIREEVFKTPDERLKELEMKSKCLSMVDTTSNTVFHAVLQCLVAQTSLIKHFLEDDRVFETNIRTPKTMTELFNKMFNLMFKQAKKEKSFNSMLIKPLLREH